MKKLIMSAALLLLTMLWLPKASALCSVGNSSLVFGSFNTLTGDTVDSTGTITVTCILSLSLTLLRSRPAAAEPLTRAAWPVAAIIWNTISTLTPPIARSGAMAPAAAL